MDNLQEQAISYCLHNGSNTLIEIEEGKTILELGKRQTPPTPALLTPIVLQPIQTEPQNFVIHSGDHWIRDENAPTAFKTVYPSTRQSRSDKMDNPNWKAMAKLSDLGED